MRALLMAALVGAASVSPVQAEFVSQTAWVSSPAVAAGDAAGLRVDPLAVWDFDDDPSRSFVLTQRTALSSADESGPSLRTSELGVWAIVRMAQALRSGDRFEVLDASLDTMSLLPSASVAPVPLPASLWFLLVGLLGLVGARLTPSVDRTTSHAAATPSVILAGHRRRLRWPIWCRSSWPSSRHSPHEVGGLLAEG